MEEDKNNEQKLDQQIETKLINLERNFFCIIIGF